MAIIALVLGLATPMISRGLPGQSLRLARDDLMQGLRRAQSAAIGRNEEVVFLLDLEARSYRVSSEREAMALPDDISIDVVVGNDEVESGGRGGIRFFPDGSSTGGWIDIGFDEARHRISVDWLTGRVRMTERDAR